MQMEHFIPGTSFCGVIPAQKHIPISFSVGDRVAGIVANGGWGEFVAVDIERIWKIEDDVSFAEGAAAAGDSYRIVSGIRDMKLLGGEHVLVAGGITAAGCMCMQLIRGLYGGRVVVAVEGERDAKLALSKFSFTSILCIIYAPCI